MAVAFLNEGEDVLSAGSFNPGNATDGLVVWSLFSIRPGANGQITYSAHQWDSNNLTLETGMNDLFQTDDQLDASGFIGAYYAYGTADPAAGNCTVTDSEEPEGGEYGYAVALQGVDQATPVPASNGSAFAYYNTDAPTGLSFDAPAGSYALYVAWHESDGTFTDPSGWGTPLYSEAKDFGGPILTNLGVWGRAYASSSIGETVAHSHSVSDVGIHGVIVFQQEATATYNIVTAPPPITILNR